MKYTDYYKHLNESLVDKKIITVPDEAGTKPIPSNHLRLYHYTHADPEEIKRDGLKISKAKGDTYGEPNFVWASLKKPSESKTYVELVLSYLLFSISLLFEIYVINLLYDIL